MGDWWAYASRVESPVITASRLQGDINRTSRVNRGGLRERKRRSGAEFSAICLAMAHGALHGVRLFFDRVGVIDPAEPDMKVRVLLCVPLT